MLKETWRIANQEDNPLMKLLEHPNAKTRMKSKGYYRKIGTTKVMRSSFINSIIIIWNKYHLRLENVPEKLVKKEIQTIMNWII